MTLYMETKTFLIFVLLGLLFSFIFDIFRAIRRVRKPKKYSVYIQDIIYFFIVGIILLILMINMINIEVRLYNILAIVLGIVIYISVFGNIMRNIFCKIFRLNGIILDFIIMPISVFTTLFSKQINKFKKIVRNCCKKNLYMINFKCANIKDKLLKKKLKTKEDFLNDKKSKSNC